LYFLTISFFLIKITYNRFEYKTHSPVMVLLIINNFIGFKFHHTDLLDESLICFTEILLNENYNKLGTLIDFLVETGTNP